MAFLALDSVTRIGFVTRRSVAHPTNVRRHSRLRNGTGFVLLIVMPLFGIFRLRDTAQERFRWSPKATSSSSPSEVLSLKPTEYRDDGEIEATSPYAAWEQSRLGGNEVRVGDVVQDRDGNTLWICKFNGFERAQWAETEATEDQLPAADETLATQESAVAHSETPKRDELS